MSDLLGELSNEDDLGELAELRTDFFNYNQVCTACFNTFMKGNGNNV